MQHAQIVGGLESMPCTHISMALSQAPNLSMSSPILFHLTVILHCAQSNFMKMPLHSPVKMNY